MKLTRRTLLARGAAAATLPALAGCATTRRSGIAGPGTVGRRGTTFVRDGEDYRVVGANMWYAAWLGADAPYGNRARLGRELDRLSAIGVNNLRIQASGEEGPLNNSIKPGFTRADGSSNEALFEGLDYVLAEMGKRGMTAVLVLSNFWEWSGGLQTLLWRATREYMDMDDPANPWPAFADATAEFYANDTARALYAEHLARVVGRTNSVTGRRYAEDNAIFSWQLANEPRPGGSDAAIARNREAYLRWIAETAAAIRSLDRNHMISLGQEGTQATNGDAALVAEAHKSVDYLTAHIWPLNWGWVEGDDLAGTWRNAERLTKDYIAAHTDLATSAGKPLLLEEFGFPRDRESYSPGAATSFRQRFYATIYDAVEASWSSGGPLRGSNFWAWNGEARAAHRDYRFRDGDNAGGLAYMGDPPHEPQGWYGNFDSDMNMLRLVSTHAGKAAIA